MIALLPVRGIPIIQPGDDLPTILQQQLAALAPKSGDILVVTSKIISKAEGRFVNLRDIPPSAQAVELGIKTQKDPRLVELILRESIEISRYAPTVLITRHKLGFVSANAGIDHSNTAVDPDIVLLLPSNPDAYAKQLREYFSTQLGVDLGIIIADSHGRPHRWGTMGVAVGVAGLPGVEDWRGRPDLFGFKLQHTEIALADMVASAATLVLGQAAEGIPAVLVRGVIHSQRDGNAAEIYRPAAKDLYK
ncbi:MAG: coenzyme F420-0:L-glutamate ligase [Anaerolineae bacterium]|nr:coenzyme F420-0:L-glutamate ligase [Anaerolineae bacterium]